MSVVEVSVPALTGPEENETLALGHRVVAFRGTECLRSVCDGSFGTVLLLLSKNSAKCYGPGVCPHHRSRIRIKVIKHSSRNELSLEFVERLLMCVFL